MLTSDFKVCFPVPCFEASLGRPVIPSVLHPSVSIGTARGLVGRCFFFFLLTDQNQTKSALSLRIHSG